jgi:hypothetical protein
MREGGQWPPWLWESVGICNEKSVCLVSCVLFIVPLLISSCVWDVIFAMGNPCCVAGSVRVCSHDFSCRLVLQWFSPFPLFFLLVELPCAPIRSSFSSGLDLRRGQFSLWHPSSIPLFSTQIRASYCFLDGFVFLSSVSCGARIFSRGPSRQKL